MIRWISVICVLFSVWTGFSKPIDPLYEEAFNYMEMDTGSPGSFQWSPSSEKLSFIQDKDGDGSRDLWTLDIHTMKASRLVNASSLSGEISEEEKQLKERMRVGGKGIAFYSWLNNSDSLIFSAGGKLYLADSDQNVIKELNIKQSPVLFPKVSPDDSTIGFVSGNELYVFNMNSGSVVQLTHSSSETAFNGMAEYGAAEELDRHEGFWFSPDSRYVYYTHVEEKDVSSHVFTNNTSFEGEWHVQRYPFAGKANPEVTLRKVKIDGEGDIQLNFPVKGEYYIARVDFIDNDMALQVISRDQKDLTLFRYKEGHPDVLIHEHNERWINLHGHFRYIKDKKGFLWSSEKSGYRHLYFYSLDDGTSIQLTSGKWVVRDVNAVTDKAVFFTANKGNPNRFRLFSLSLIDHSMSDTDMPEGSHRITMSSDGKFYLDSYSQVTVPESIDFVSVKTGKRESVVKETLFKGNGLCSLVTERVTFNAQDGTQLFGFVQYDKALDPGKKHPVIVYTYGGPHGQVAADAFRGRNFYWHNYLATKGFVVFWMDNRGSSNRGLEFEQAIYKNMGDLELRDQIDGLNAVSEKYPFVDRHRAGLWGWSYGGYMACMSMTKFSGEFAAAAGVAPVSDWHLYDAPYTERYMETPETNPEGYESSSVLNFVEKLNGPLLILHGVSDDNVHFNQTELMLKAFVEAEKYPELMVYPGKKHSIRGNAYRKHVFWKISEFFIRHLNPGM